MGVLIVSVVVLATAIYIVLRSPEDTLETPPTVNEGSLESTQVTCSNLSVADRELKYCSREFDNGFKSLVLSGAGAQATLVVDLGGPVVPYDDLYDALLEIADVDSGFFNLVAVAAPLPPALSNDCRLASVDRSEEACNFSDIEAEYTVEYLSVLKDELQSSDLYGGSVQLLGASYAATRWYRIITEVESDNLVFDRATFVSPLLPGTDAVELTHDIFDVAHRLFYHGDTTGCWTEECLSSIDLTELCPHCDLAERLETATGLSTNEVQMGLAGLAPFVELDGPRLSRALRVDDIEQLIDLLSRGRESFLGIDVRGALHSDMVHVLAATCPVLSGDVEKAGEPYLRCSNTSPLDRHDIESLDFSSSLLRNACFVSTQPDPVLGLATTLGAMFGDGASFTVHDRGFGHGDLTVGFDYHQRGLSGVASCARS